LEVVAVIIQKLLYPLICFLVQPHFHSDMIYLFIYSGTSQGIYYGSEGNSPNRTMVFEFYMSHYNQPAEYYQYQVLFFEALPEIVQYKYFDVSDGGISCTIGVQGERILVMLSIV
jgi:hypothetical protein